MMNERQLANSIINFNGEVSESVNIIKNTAPEFLIERYSICSVEYLDTFLAIVSAKIPELVNNVGNVYLKYLDKNALYLLWASYVVGKPLEVDDEKFQHDIIEIKNQWLLSVVVSMDEMVDIVESGSFNN